MKLEINRNKSGKFTNLWKLNSKLLNNQRLNENRQMKQTLNIPGLTGNGRSSVGKWMTINANVKKTRKID